MSEPQSQVRRGGPFFLILAASLTAIIPMTLDFYLPSFPLIAEDFATDVGHVQFTMSAALLGFGIGQLLWGPIVDRFGRRNPILIGMSIFVIATIACVFAPTLGWLVAFRVIETVGGCAAVVASRAMARDIYSGQALARALSIIFLIFGLAPVLSPAIGGVLLNWMPWQGLFVILACFGVATMIGTLMFGETLPKDRRSRNSLSQVFASFGTVIRNPFGARVGVLMFLAGAALFSWVSGAPRALLEAGGLSLTMFTVVFGIVSFSIVVGSQLNVWLLKRIDVHVLLPRFVVVMATAGVVGILVASLPVPFWVVIVAEMLTICWVVTIISNSMAIGLGPFGALAGIAAGLFGTTQALGGALAAAALTALPVNGAVALALGMAVPMVLAIPFAFSLRKVSAA